MVDGVVVDTPEHLAQVGLGVEAVELGASNEAVKDCGAISSGIGSGEEVVAAAHGDGAESAFGGGVIDLDATFVAV